MSRIHDALKRAEQERAAALGTQIETSVGQLESPAFEMPSMQSPSPAMNSLSPAANLETLVSRCKRTEWTPDSRTMLFFQDDETRLGAEEFRTLRSRLYQIREKMPLRRILVTSAMPREGKSFVAANLAQVMVRQHGRRALVIDADLRSPGMHRHLGTAQTPGLAEYLSGQCDEFAILQHGPMENLFFIPGGKVAGSAPELLANGRLKLLLQRVEPMFDWVILDSSPVIPVSDSTLVAGNCDGVLFVVRSSVTPTDLAKRAREEFPDKLLLGVVLNGAPSGKLSQTKYYYGEAVSSQA